MTGSDADALIRLSAAFTGSPTVMVSNDDNVVAASGDRQLLDAWSALGVDTFDTNQPLR